MLEISTSFLHHNRFIYNGFKDCIYNLGRNVLNYAVRHQYSLSVYVWSYFLIEVGRTAAETNFGETYVYNLDTCRDLLCNKYFNKSKETNDFFYNPVVEFRCSELQKSSYSFIECLQDLCNYITTIGENFYACVETLEPEEPLVFNGIIGEEIPESEMPPPVLDYWNKICPKKHYRHPDKTGTKLRELAYLTDCLETFCTPDNLLRFESTKELTSLCAHKEVMKLYELLHRMSRAIKKLQKANIETNKDTSNLIANIIVALSTVVGGAATIAAAIITYRTSKAAHILQNVIPPLDEGVKTISRAAVQTTRAIIRGASIVEEMVSPEILQTFHELSSTITQGSSPSSFYSARGRLSPESEIRVKFDPSTKIINFIGGGLVIGAGSIISIAGNSEGNGGSSDKHEQSELDQTIEKITLATFNIKELLSSLESTSLAPPFLDLPIFNIRESWGFSYLKNTLPNWKGAYCFYEGIEKFLFCKFPRPPFDHYISFFLEDLKDFFSKNTDVLCVTTNQELWCNWGNFLNLILPIRNITFMFPNCSWDHFGLEIDKISNDTYFFEASGVCYNETNLLKV